MLGRALQLSRGSPGPTVDLEPGQNTLNARKGITTKFDSIQAVNSSNCQNTLNARKGITT